MPKGPILFAHEAPEFEVGSTVIVMDLRSGGETIRVAVTRNTLFLMGARVHNALKEYDAQKGALVAFTGREAVAHA